MIHQPNNQVWSGQWWAHGALFQLMTDKFCPGLERVIKDGLNGIHNVLFIYLFPEY